MLIMKNLKTSTQIALKFTIYFFVIFSLLGVSINALFFQQWVSNEYNRVTNRWQNNDHKPWGRFKEIPSPMVNLNYTTDIATELNEHTVINNISNIDGTYIMYTISPTDNTIRIMDVSRPMEMQYTLLWTTILIIIGGTVFTFGISRRFARSSLQKINELVKYTQTLDIHHLTKKVPISWPNDDEIRIIASAFQKALDTIKEQTDSLKDFVSYASHELKTPLSTIRGLIDLGTKTKSIETVGPKIKKTLTEMSDLLETLLGITRWEFEDIKKENIDIIPLISSVVEQISDQYADKKIEYFGSYPDQYTVAGKSDIIKIIISNLITNAYKFTPDHGTISLTIEKNTIIISDTGRGISPTDQDKIRTRFWKKSDEHNTWYGLWLYMVKLLVEKLGRSITVKSEENHWTTFTISIH